MELGDNIVILKNVKGDPIMSKGINSRKVAVIGTGFVGSSSAFALMESGLFTEMVLIDADKNRAEGEALDIAHAGQKPGETRLDLVKKNVAIFQSIIPEIAQRKCEGILLIVANPVDILTQVAVKLSGFPENRVFGSGTTLDSARLKYLLGEHLQVDARSVHAWIIGEHGDSEIVAWSSANVSGVPISEFCEMRGYTEHDEHMEEIAQGVKNSAYKIIEKKKATYYGVAMAVRRICEAIIRDEKSVLPVSSIQHDTYGIEGVTLSMPAIVGKNGIEKQLAIKLNEKEQEALKKSAEALKEVLEDLDI